MIVATLIADCLLLILLLVTAWSWRRLAGRIAEFKALREEIALADRDSQLRLEEVRAELSKIVQAAKELTPALSQSVSKGEPLLNELRFVSKMAESTADRLVAENEEASKAGNRLARLATTIQRNLRTTDEAEDAEDEEEGYSSSPAPLVEAPIPISRGRRRGRAAAALAQTKLQDKEADILTSDELRLLRVLSEGAE
ncbi:hypothetical protein [Azospirillum sp. SYSU D00513]|uniref:hypothetical protein n=1 Tax=Azospirillum sp. SYSU D00513 TaxID=2812561 RepID=UPI001A96E361|nr:hypothetical protein [Azospirillum sp. SYSU D00513]